MTEPSVRAVLVPSELLADLARLLDTSDLTLVHAPAVLGHPSGTLLLAPHAPAIAPEDAPAGDDVTVTMRQGDSAFRANFPPSLLRLSDAHVTRVDLMLRGLNESLGEQVLPLLAPDEVGRECTCRHSQHRHPVYAYNVGGQALTAVRACADDACECVYRPADHPLN